MSDTPPVPPDDDTRPFVTPRSEQPEAQQQPQLVGQPAGQPVGQPPGQPVGQPPGPPYAAPYGGPQYAGHPAYPGYPPPPRPKFSDQVLGMRAVVAVALVALLIGGLGGALLGALTTGSNDDARFVGPGGFPQGGFGQVPNQGQLPQQQFGQNQP